MVKLDVSLLRYLTQEDFKVLTSVEMGMRNHELVPGTLINSIASLRFGGCGKVLVELTKHKLLAYERGKRYDGYRLTYAGYDYLALNVLNHRNIIGGVGNQIGVGKESDVFICECPQQTKRYAIKFHRLGRVCFRKVSEKRDFYTKTKNKTSWIYLSRKAAQREYEFLRYLYCKGMPVPKPIDSNRHVVVMELVDGRILNHYTLESFEEADRDTQISTLYKKLMDLILRFANDTRLIHGDFNEFNIIIKHNDEDGTLEPVVIDLPQMIGVDQELAPEQFERDVNCIVDFFEKRFRYTSDYIPKWEDVSDKPVEKDAMEEFLQNALERIVKIDDDDYPDTNKEGEIDGPTEKSISESISSEGDLDDCPSVAPTLEFAPVDAESARRRLMLEMNRKTANKKKREAAKPKNIKGDANPVRRRKKTNNHVICEDASAFIDMFN